MTKQTCKLHESPLGLLLWASWPMLNQSDLMRTGWRWWHLWPGQQDHSKVASRVACHVLSRGVTSWRHRRLGRVAGQGERKCRRHLSRKPAVQLHAIANPQNTSCVRAREQPGDGRGGRLLKPALFHRRQGAYSNGTPLKRACRGSDSFNAKASVPRRHYLRRPGVAPGAGAVGLNLIIRNQTLPVLHGPVVLPF